MREKREKLGGRRPRLGDDAKPCPYCGQMRPAAKQCHARSKQTGEQCKRPVVEGWAVCYYHGAGGGRPPSTFRYARALNASPELKAAYEEVMRAGGDEYDLTDELVLARARLNACVTAGNADLKTVNEMLKDLTKAIQKNIELKMKLQGMVHRGDVEKLLRQAMQIMVVYVPDSLRDRCFEEVASLLTGGKGLLEPANVVTVPALPAGDPNA